MSASSRDGDRFDLLPPLDDAAGPALRISAARAAAIVATAVERATPTVETRRTSARRGRWIALVAAIVCASVVATAAVIQLRKPPPPEQAPAPTPAARPPVAPPAAPTAEVAPTPPEPAPVARPALTRAPKSRTRPDDLLRRANALRGERDWRAAVQLYERVARQSPASTAGYVATVAAASLHLEQLGRPGRALRAFRRALRQRPKGTLAEEVRYGIAEAHRALGDESAEAHALTEFLAAHPRSPLRARAQRRQQQLTRDKP